MRTAFPRGLAAVVLAAGLTATATPATAAPAATDRHGWALHSAGRLPGSYFSAIASSRPWDAWAAGHQVDGTGRARGVLLHWQGRQWNRVPAAGLPKVSYWHSVATSSPRNVWVYGWSQTRQSMAHFDGRRWREVAMPDDMVTHGFAKLAVAPGATWLASERWAARRVRGGWRSTSFPQGVTVTSIDARSAREVWVAGYRHAPGEPVQPYAARWNGRTFVPVATPDNGLVVRDLYVDRRNNVWLVGQIPQGWEDHRPAVLHWDGRRWRDLGLPDQNQWPEAVSVARDGTVWVTGDPEGFEGPATFWGHDGRRWRTVTAELPRGAFAPRIAGLAPIPGTNRMWAVGGYEVVVGEGSSQSYESFHVYR
ncbi:hypothetical protein [Thermomonospora cellulosilytica]|uniref:Uncharacterized protein n=1 Tax=Thermomonospora cellulosilytica TaxID=1411118 RepID=A0A7W3N0I9_9ACTN|nr:hypothetical protein [Thermomonospora cellulosilytica]MBA9005307.1 hypothetical protein [Thermomonospora cellulosilytica]